MKLHSSGAAWWTGATGPLVRAASDLQALERWRPLSWTVGSCSLRFFLKSQRHKTNPRRWGFSLVSSVFRTPCPKALEPQDLLFPGSDVLRVLCFHCPVLQGLLLSSVLRVLNSRALCSHCLMLVSVSCSQGHDLLAPIRSQCSVVPVPMLLLPFVSQTSQMFPGSSVARAMFCQCPYVPSA